MESLEAICTPPHDIPGKPVAGFLPKGKGSRLLLDLMHRSEAVLKDHPVNLARIARGRNSCDHHLAFLAQRPSSRTALVPAKLTGSRRV